MNLPQRPESSFANDIEGELFTTGLINAPGLNSRMKRLSKRQRILPDFESDSEENTSENEDQKRDDAQEIEEDSSGLIVFEKPVIRPQTVPQSILHGSITKSTSTSERARRLSDKPDTSILMTSGVVSFINEDAKLKQVTKAENDSEFQPKKSTPSSVPVTGFRIHSQMRNTNGSHQQSGHTNDGPSNNKPKIDRKKSVQFSPHRKSVVIAPDIFAAERPDPAFGPIGGRGSHSRLSVVKSKIKSNEKAFLLRLRIENQKQENEDVSKRVWDFIGQRPTSMFVPRKINKLDEDNNDILTEAEEEMKRSKFKAAANKTSIDP